MTLVAYADLEDDLLVSAALRVDGRAAAGPQLEALARELFGADAGPEAAIAARVLSSCGPFGRAARRGIDADDPRLGVAAAELDRLGALAHGLVQRAALDAYVAMPRPDRSLPPAAAALTAELAAAPQWGLLAPRLAAFHRDEGCGALATHRVLRYVDDALRPVERPDPIGLDDLTGFDDVRAPLLEDLAAFCAGDPANDALLYGPPGTGKSATVRACAAAFAGRGLRLVQVGSDELGHLEAIFAALAGPGPPTLVFLDDLVFDDAGRRDRELRGSLEGGVDARPANVLIWVTSNRLNLTHETHGQRADEIDPAEARGEKVALANRFGRRVRFDIRGEQPYLAIVRRLLRDRVGSVPDGAEALALRFARTGPGPTPRAARQFAAGYRDGA